MSGFHIETIADTGVQIVSFPHEDGRKVDLDTVRTFFTGRFFDDTQSAKHLVIDLSGVGTLDSSSLSPLVQRLRELQESGGTMVLCGIKSAGLREILSLTRFDRIFDIFADQAEALQAFKA